MGSSGGTHLESYLAQLPRGLDSYPECRVRGGTLVAALELLDLDGDEELETLPSAVREWVQSPPPRTRHIPEVHNLAFYCWIRDQRFQSDHDYLTFVDAVFRRFYASPLYRVAFMMSRPEVVAAASPRIWSWVRDGTRLEVLSREPGYVHLRVNTPPHLFSPLHGEVLARGLGIAYRSAAPAAKPLEVTVREQEPTALELDVRWRDPAD